MTRTGIDTVAIQVVSMLTCVSSAIVSAVLRGKELDAGIGVPDESTLKVRLAESDKEWHCVDGNWELRSP